MPQSSGAADWSRDGPGQAWPMSPARLLPVLWGAAWLICVGVGTGCLASGSAASQCHAERSHRPPSAAEHESSPSTFPDEVFNALFTRYGGGWTGGDGTFSVLLPDGRTVWMFGDTFLGTVDRDRSRPATSPLIHNSFVVQDNKSLTTFRGGSAGKPEALITPSDGSSWYWPGDGTVENNKLRVFLRKFQRTGDGMWDWVWVGTDIATFSLPDLNLETISAGVTENGVLYGSAILEDVAYTYIYGTEDLRAKKYGHVARAERNALLGRWEFFAGEGWSSDPMSSVRMVADVANQYSVIRMEEQYVLITMDNRKPFGKDIVGYRANGPSGPWSESVLLYSTPQARGDIFTYNAFAHPQFTRNGQFLVSYNVNSLGGLPSLFDDADNYRPRFIRVNVKSLWR
jgi:hypothetical protein